MSSFPVSLTCSFGSFSVSSGFSFSDSQKPKGKAQLCQGYFCSRPRSQRNSSGITPWSLLSLPSSSLSAVLGPPHPTPPRGESRTRMSNSTSPAAVRQSMLNPVTPQSDTSEASLSQLDPVTPVTEGGSSYTHCGSFLATSIMCYRGWKTKDQPSPSPLEATGQNEMVSPSSLMRCVCYPCALAAGGVAS